jgi:hypothetical protein
VKDRLEDMIRASASQQRKRYRSAQDLPARIEHRRRQRLARRVTSGGVVAVVIVGLIGFAATRDFGGDDTPIAAPNSSAATDTRRTTTALPSGSLDPTELVAVMSPVTEDNPTPDIRRLDLDGNELGAWQITDEAASIGPGRLDDGRVVTLDASAEGATGCTAGGALTITDDPAQPGDTVHDDLTHAHHAAVAPNGTVVAIRPVCPGGKQWGDDGTGYEVVKLDLAAIPSELSRVLFLPVNVTAPAHSQEGAIVDFQVAPDGALFSITREVGTTTYGPQRETTRIYRAWGTYDTPIGQFENTCGPLSAEARPLLLDDGVYVFAQLCADEAAGGTPIIRVIAHRYDGINLTTVEGATSQVSLGVQPGANPRLTMNGQLGANRALPWIVLTYQDGASRIRYVVHGESVTNLADEFGQAHDVAFDVSDLALVPGR